LSEAAAASITVSTVQHSWYLMNTMQLTILTNLHSYEP